MSEKYKALKEYIEACKKEDIPSFFILDHIVQSFGCMSEFTNCHVSNDINSLLKEWYEKQK